MELFWEVTGTLGSGVKLEEIVILEGGAGLIKAPFLSCSLDTLSTIGVASPPPYVPAPLRSVHACKSCDHRQILQNHELKQLSAPISCF